MSDETKKAEGPPEKDNPAAESGLERDSAPGGLVAEDAEYAAARREEKREREKRREMVRREVWEWAKAVVTALILAILIKTNVVQAYKIPTGSMEPTIMPGDRVFGNRFVFRFREPHRGDIIAFKPPPVLHQKTSFLKRIVAVEHDTVTIIGGVVYINGYPLDEPYIMAPPGMDFELVRVPPDHVFVMGDNRNNSHDSRYWGFLETDSIQAKAFFRFWPPGRIGLVR